jgi:hypothetical protein
MNLKLRSTLCLLSMSALVIDGAIAQPGRKPSVDDWRAKFAYDYNSGKFRDVIADEAALEKLHAMNLQMGMVTAQAYYHSGNMRGCVKYIQEKLDPLSNRTTALLLKRCQTR